MAINNEKFGDGARRRSNSRVQSDVVDGKGPAQRNPVIATQRFGGSVPQVTGLTLGQSPGAVEASWDAAPIADLKRYEVHVSTSAAFVEPSIRYSAESRFTFEDGIASTDYYFRVRAFNTGNIPGEWSLTEVAQPGAVTAADIADGSITEAKLATNSVTAAKIATNAVGSDEIAAGAVDTSELASESVHTEDLTFTSGTVVNSGTTELQVATENITSDGDEIKIYFGFTFVFNGGTTDGNWTFRVREGTGGGGTAIYTQTGIVSDTGTPGVRVWFAKLAATPGSGSRTYEVTVQRISGDRDITVANRTIHLEESHR